MIVGLLIILALILVLPFAIRQVEHNLEYFLFVMGLSAIIVSGVLSKEFVLHTLSNYLIYTITAAVLVAGLLFSYYKDKINYMVNAIVKRIPIKVFVFLLIVILGFLSSIITAIVAALLLAEIVAILPIDRDKKIKVDIVACFAIGLGAVLTPIGEPLATIVISTLKADFFFLFRNLGIDIIPPILALGMLGAFLCEDKKGSLPVENEVNGDLTNEANVKMDLTKDELKEVFVRAGKIFVFIVALEFLGAGFRPLIDTYVIHLDSRILYFINMLSSVLDNATMAAAEISTSMNDFQIKVILMGLLISGGMLIPGNIPNIITAGKLKIKSKEWAKLGIPLGLVLLAIYYVVLFVL